MILSALQIKGGQRFLAFFFGANATWLRYICVNNPNSLSYLSSFFSNKNDCLDYYSYLFNPPIIISSDVSTGAAQWCSCSFFSKEFAYSSLVRRQSGYRCECECGYFHWHHTPLSDILGRVQLAAPHIQPVRPTFLWPRGYSITQLLWGPKSETQNQPTIQSSA